jgi:ParB/RepB/Spo0J family partition protein
MNIQDIRLSDIQPDPDQPRKTFDSDALERLSQSIHDNGIEQPITVRPNGKGYIIIDGERRWRAAKTAGLKDIPSIISGDDSILEKQLRSDCLKEGLNVDELDRAIYRYWEKLATSCKFSEWLSKNRTNKTTADHSKHEYIAFEIGKSYERVRKAIDRFTFKRDNREFTNQIEQEHGKEKYGKVNSTIAMTDKLKEKPEVRKAVVKEILSADRGKDAVINNVKIKSAIDRISNSPGITVEAARNVIKTISKKQVKPDIAIVYEQHVQKFISCILDFKKANFLKYSEHIDFKELISCLEDFTKELRSTK